MPCSYLWIPTKEEDRMNGLIWSMLLALGWLHTVHSASSGAEHKVPYIHNIVLYPDKHSWCKTTEIKQIVAYPGCSSVEIDNSVCVGACFSYSIPKTLPSAPGEVITPYCDSCQPASFTWKEVKLTCHDESNEDEDAFVELTKKVQVINNCTCTSCADQKDNIHTENHKHAEKDKSDVPELMSLMLQHKNTDVDDDDDEMEDPKLPSLLTDAQTDINREVYNVIDDYKDDKTNGRGDEKDEDVASKQKTNTHLVLGPHHALVVMPDVIPVHHQQESTIRHHKQSDETVPSLLQNQFKIHENDEYIDQLAVESKKEYSTKSTELFTLPELIYKEHANTSVKEEEHSEKIDEDKKKNSLHHHHHHTEHHRGNEKQDHLENHHRHNIPEESAMKVVDLPHHHLQPAVEGAAVTYVVKKEEPKKE